MHAVQNIEKRFAVFLLARESERMQEIDPKQSIVKMEGIYTVSYTHLYGCNPENRRGVPHWESNYGL